MMRARQGPDAVQERQEVLSAHELIERVAWIVRLRWVAAACVAAAITIARWQFGLPLPAGPLYVITAALVAYNAVMWGLTRRLQGWQPRSALAASALANIQISADLFFLAALLYFSGGIENPFTFYFVFHIVIASILLSRRATFFQTALASAYVVAMAVVQSEDLAPHFHLTGVLADHAHRKAVLAYGTSFVVASTLFLTAYFATSITARLREREAEILGLSRSLEEKAADLSRANEKLRISERTKSEYMRRVAHELRSPLATVYQMVGLVADGRKGDIPPAAGETLARVRVRLKLLMDVARDLLALSRAREADLSRELQETTLAEAVAACLPDLQERAQEAGLRLDVSVPDELPAIAGDPESLPQLVANLCTNAIKYTPAGGSVRITGCAEQGRVELAVADSGIGIPRDELSHVFNEFYRAGNAREACEDGTGLGLSIVNAICFAHRAEILVESEVGQGTTFRVRFPIASARPGSMRPTPDRPGQ